jgi:hypothetical protein
VALDSCSDEHVSASDTDGPTVRLEFMLRFVIDRKKTHDGFVAGIVEIENNNGFIRIDTNASRSDRRVFIERTCRSIYMFMLFLSAEQSRHIHYSANWY